MAENDDTPKYEKPDLKPLGGNQEELSNKDLDSVAGGATCSVGMDPHSSDCLSGSGAYVTCNTGSGAQSTCSGGNRALATCSEGSGAYNWG